MPTASIAKGRGYLNHNDRSIDRVSEKSWDPELSRKNVICRNIPIQDAYNQIFGKALSEYNQRQIDVNHPERQIKNYYDHISRSKQEKPFYEFVVAFGNMNDKNTDIYPVLQRCLDEYITNFDERNPNFKVFQKIVHLDEKGIDHAHLDFIPVSTHNKRGLSVKNSFRGALKEMGYTGKTAFLDWRQSEEKYMADILERHGLEFERGSGRDEHLNVRQYQAEAREINRLAQQKLKNMELPSIPEPEIKTNPITKSESVKLSKAEFDKIKQVIDYQQTQITSLEAQKSDLSAKLENVELKLDTARKKPYMRENEALTQNLKKESNLSEELTKKYGALSNECIELRKSCNKLKKEVSSLHEKNTGLEKENSKLHLENASQFRKIKELEMKISNISQEFYSKITNAYVSIKNIVQAVGMLKYDKDGEYRIKNITDKQERLIDGVSEYGSALAKENDYPELAKKMDNTVGINEAIENFVKLPEPERTRESRSSRDWDLER
jgi:predicted  nucleic acid-binding Zn-ribbon protein